MSIEDDILDALSTHKKTTSVIFEHCTSTTWDAIGGILGSLKLLETLVARHCNIGDALY